jgi:hypothetical protein
MNGDDDDAAVKGVADDDDTAVVLGHFWELNIYKILF